MMNSCAKYLRIFITVGFSIIIIWQISHRFCEMDKITKDSMVKAKQICQCHGMERNDGNSTALEFFKRLSNLQYQCKIRSIDNTGKWPQLYIAKNNNLKYCKVPKSGSTFWMSVFVIIDQVADFQNPFGNTRGYIHLKGSMFKKDVTFSNISSSDVVVFVARDPFSRLLSAFIDKIFLPCYWHVFPHISNDKTPICDKRNTFSVFVDFIVRSSRDKGTLVNEHWRPISELCTPCRIPYNFIVKQETFQRDVKFVLNQINMSQSQRKAIHEGLQAKHTNYSMAEVIKVQSSFAQKANKSCMSFEDFTRRLWKAFQIQGYIFDAIPFPADKFVGLNYSSVKEMVNIYLQGANQHKLSAVEKLNQRNHYLREAYRTIRNESLLSLLDIYDDDFLLLGYTPVPPHLKPI